MDQSEPLNVKLKPAAVIAMDLANYVDDLSQHSAFLRYKGLDTLATQRILRSKLSDLRRSATGFLSSSEANPATILEVAAQVRAIVQPFADQPESSMAAHRMLTGLDNIAHRLRRTTSQAECEINVGSFMLPTH